MKEGSCSKIGAHLMMWPGRTVVVTFIPRSAMLFHGIWTAGPDLFGNSPCAHHQRLTVTTTLD